MNRFKLICFIQFLCLLFAFSTLAGAEEHLDMEGPYQVVSARVDRIEARTLFVGGIQYPISVFARVFKDSERGEELKLHTLVGVGRIEKAKLLILKGKVEKIIVLKMI